MPGNFLKHLLMGLKFSMLGLCLKVNLLEEGLNNILSGVTVIVKIV